jgi:hypothetical protein
MLHTKIPTATKYSALPTCNGMWLQIDIYPAVEGTNGTAVPASLEPTATHFIRTTRTTSGAEECLWSIGRKAGQYHATKDRSVSKEHLRLFAASDDNQVVVQNMGKLGSYLVRTDPLIKEMSHAKTNRDDDDSSVTTVDEDDPVLTQRSLTLDVAVSQVAQHFAAPQTKQRLQPINLEESLTLPFVSPYPEHSTSQNPGNHEEGGEAAISPPSSLPPCARWILQCGKMGTTLVVTRIDICFVASGNKAKNALRSMHEALTAVGARTAETFSASEHAKNYLLTDVFGAKPKHILAWARHATVVPAAFLDTFLAYAGSVAPLQAPWPPEDTVPVLAPPPHWSPGPPDPHLWKDGTLVSLLPANVPSAAPDAEMEELVLAAGARKIPLHSLKELEPLWQKAAREEDIRRLLETFWAEFQQKHPLSFLLNSTHVKAQCPLLVKVLEELGVSFVTSKAIAQAVTQQQNLGTLLPAPHATLAKAPVATKPAVSSLPAQTRHSSQRSCRKPPPAKVATLAEEDEDVIVESPVNMALDLDTDPFVDEVKSKDDENDADGNMGVDTSSVANNMDYSRTLDDSVSEVHAEETTRLGAPLMDETVDARPKKRSTSGSLARPSQLPRQTTPDGWMKALPQGQSRKKFCRRPDLATRGDGEETVVYEPAITQTVKGLIASHVGTSMSRHAPSTSTMPNFKAFRKNVVPPVLSVGITLQYDRSSNSKTLYHGDLDKQREQMEAQQRRADELFRLH